MKWPYIFEGITAMKAFYEKLQSLFTDVGDDMQEQKTRVDNLIQNASQPSEVVDMRLGRDGQTYPVARDMVLGEIGKTEAEQAQINEDTAAQLAEKVTQINYDADRAYFESRLNALTSTFGQSFNTLDELLTSLLQSDGKNHFVTNDKSWYFWLDGFGWTSGGGIDDITLANGSIDEEKTVFFDKTIGKNKLNINDPNYKFGYTLDTSNWGEIIDDEYEEEPMSVTGYISVNEGDIVKLSRSNGVESPIRSVAAYDAEKHILSAYCAGTSNTSYQVHQIVSYIRIAVYQSHVTANLMIELTKNGVITSYEPYWQRYDIKQQYLGFIEECCFNVKRNLSFVSNNVWTSAIKNALDNHKNVYIPLKATPYVLDDRLVMHSGNRLIIHPLAEIKLADGTDTCLIRNENMSSNQTDSDIQIEGGIWDGNSENQSSIYCHSDKENYLVGVAGLISMIGVKRFKIKNLTVKSPKGFAIQVNSSDKFDIDNISLDNCESDGIHLCGGNTNFHVRRIGGQVTDDFIAMNAWDWLESTPFYGDIKNGVVEDIDGVATAGGLVRMLPGGDHTISDVEVKRISGTSNDSCFKLYNQADTPHPSNTIADGVIGNVKFENFNVKCTAENLFKLGADISKLEIKDFKTGSQAQYVSIIKQMAGYTTDILKLDGFNPLMPLLLDVMDIEGVINNLILNNIYNNYSEASDYSFINVKTGGGIGKAVVHNFNQENGSAFAKYQSGALESDLVLSSSMLKGVKHSLYSANKLHVKLFSCKFDSIPNDIIMMESGSDIDIRSTDCDLVNSPSAKAIAKDGGTIRWCGTDISLNAADLAPEANDMINNDNSDLACGSGIILRNNENTQWKNLFTGSIY